MKTLLLKFDLFFGENKEFNTIDIHKDFYKHSGTVNWVQGFYGSGTVPRINEEILTEINQADKPFIFLASNMYKNTRKLYIAEIDRIFNSADINNLDAESLSYYESLVPPIYHHSRKSSLTQSRGFFIITKITELEYDYFFTLLTDQDGNHLNLGNQANVRIVSINEVVSEEVLNKSKMIDTPINDDSFDEDPNDVSSTRSGNPNATDECKKRKLKKSRGKMVIDRDKTLVADALAIADYSCEYCHTDNHIFKRHNNSPYTEAHHLIPVSKYEIYPENISPDSLANIVSLCIYCHKTIHYGQEEEINRMLDALSRARFKRLYDSNLLFENETEEDFLKRLQSYYLK